ncbi:MAG: hypothetical protein L0Z50_13255 [Verrucomicrobiales bacterium]|nr:hypothetical protein [Verrucomicrobiales bacterium]
MNIPKRLRIYFRFDRRLLGELCRVAWEVVRTVLGSVCGRPDAVPGIIGAIQIDSTGNLSCDRHR